MYFHDAGRDLKPEAWPLAIADLPHAAQRLWTDCQLALPFWSIGQNHVEDVGPNKLHGVMGAGLVPSTDWLGSPYGAALKWTGQSTDKVTVADPPNNVLDGFSEFTVEILFRSSTIPAGGTMIGLIGKYRPATGARAWRLFMDGDELTLQTSNDGVGNEVQVTTNANLAADTWYQAIVTFKSGVWAVRLNGALLTTDGDFSTHTTIFAGTEEFKLGQRTTAGSGSDTPLTGQISSARLWSRALSVDDTSYLWLDRWAMYDHGCLPGLAIEHMASGSAAGPWIEVGTVLKGVQNFLIPALTNGTSYDVRIKTRDATGNTSAGNTPATATPAATGVGGRSPAVKGIPTTPLPEPSRFFR